jgi:hypothetical protein
VNPGELAAQIAADVLIIEVKQRRWKRWDARTG